MDVSGRTSGSDNTQNFHNLGNNSSRGSNDYSRNSNLSEATNDLLKDGKKVANELYAEGKQRISNVQETIHSYSDELASHVHTRPIATLLMAAGVGYILASLMRHH